METQRRDGLWLNYSLVLKLEMDDGGKCPDFSLFTATSCKSSTATAFTVSPPVFTCSSNFGNCFTAVTSTTNTVDVQNSRQPYMFPLTETPGFCKAYTPSLVDSLQPGPKAPTMFLPRENVEEKGERLAHSNQRSRTENNAFFF